MKEQLEMIKSMIEKAIETCILEKDKIANPQKYISYGTVGPKGYPNDQNDRLNIGVYGDILSLLNTQKDVFDCMINLSWIEYRLGQG